MAKRNRILLGVLVAAVLALLIALCFVGNTFARYTLKQEESVTASIAEWGVTLEEGSSFSENHGITVDGLKPSAKTYDGTTQRTNEAQFVQVATLTNTGAVNATVSITESSTAASSATYQKITEAKAKEYGVVGTTGDTYVPGSDTGYAGDTETTGSDYAAEIGSHILADVYYSTESSIESADSTDLSPLSGDEITLKSSEDTENTDDPDTIYIYLEVEWISDLEDSDNIGSYLNGDGFDTWCGTWVTGFSFDITIEAYQAS